MDPVTERRRDDGAGSPRGETEPSDPALGSEWVVPTRLHEPRVFRDRREAGWALGRALARYAGRPDTVVLAIPQGGVPVGFEVALSLDAPLDVFLVRKLGLPRNDEYTIGAIASGGVRMVDEARLREMGIPTAAVERVVQKEERELRRREYVYRGDLPGIDLAGRTAILVDDGLAAGSSMRAAVKAVRELGARKIVVAVPVGSPVAVRDLARLADEAVCVSTPEPCLAAGRFYQSFDQTTDADVVVLLAQARARPGSDAIDPRLLTTRLRPSSSSPELMHLHQSPGGASRGDWRHDHSAAHR